LLAGTVAVVGLFAASCDSRNSDGIISARVFLATTLLEEPSGGVNPDPGSVRVLTNRINLLRAISPNALLDQLQGQPANAVPLGKADAETLILFETLQSAILSVDLCPTCTDNNTVSEVDLHFTLSGLQDEIGSAGVQGINLNVPPIELRNGWLLAYETGSRSLLAFRPDPVYRRALGQPQSQNFGRGNGLILSVVLRGDAIDAQVGRTNVAVSRLFEFADGKVLVFFAPNTLREVHLLELDLVQERLDFDLDDPSPASERVVEVLRGSIRRFPVGQPGVPDAPFLSLSEVQTVTQSTAVSVDGFQPVTVPTDGSSLIFDQASVHLLRVSEDPVSGRGRVAIAAPPESFLDILDTLSVTLTAAFLHPTRTEILLVDDVSNAIVAYDYSLAPGANLREAFSAESVVLGRRDPNNPRGGQIGVEDPMLLVARNDVRENRVAFDLGRDELLGLNYESSVVVIIGTRADFRFATGRDLAEFTFLEALAAPQPSRANLRVWDTASTSLLEILLGYRSLPVRQQFRD
jgi:hypothetical protein